MTDTPKDKARRKGHPFTLAHPADPLKGGLGPMPVALPTNRDEEELRNLKEFAFKVICAVTELDIWEANNAAENPRPYPKCVGLIRQAVDAYSGVCTKPPLHGCGGTT